MPPVTSGEQRGPFHPSVLAAIYGLVQLSEEGHLRTSMHTEVLWGDVTRIYPETVFSSLVYSEERTVEFVLVGSIRRVVAITVFSSPNTHRPQQQSWKPRQAVISADGQEPIVLEWHSGLKAMREIQHWKPCRAASLAVVH